MSDLENLQQDWNDLAEINPMWAIYSDPIAAGGNWDIKEFLETGRKKIKLLFNLVESLGLTINRKGSALDFGCGMGRLTQALAEEIDACYGVDISSTMLERANEINRFGDRCRYVLNTTNDLGLFDDDSFDLIVTVHVLQHIPPDLTEVYLSDFIRILKQDGILIFQLPVERLVTDRRDVILKSQPRYYPRRILNKLKSTLLGQDNTERYYRLRRLGFSKSWLYQNLGYRPRIQMYTLSETRTKDLMTSYGAAVVHVEKKKLSDMINAVFVVLKSHESTVAGTSES